MSKPLEYGQTICDMHNGLTVPEGYRMVYEYHVEAHGGSKMIEDTVRRHSDFSYTNKMLVVIGEDGEGNIVAAYSYDDRRLGFYHFKYEATK